MTRFLRRALLLPLLLLAAPASGQGPALPDSVRTVAVYSSRNSFLSDYSLDTLVAHLNRFRKDSALRFVVCTKDDSRTGFYANYVIDIHLDLREPRMATPHYETVRVLRPAARRVRSAGGVWEEVMVNVAVNEQRYVPGTMQPASAAVRLKITDRKQNQKARQESFSLLDENLFDLKVALVLQLHRLLLTSFDKE
ncbi:MAG: hypothetical protein EOO11_00030 [Chitinophagaceae bacterium]|nr:MAG: hypothetical protein EOO11_00030 [Chitinophagaceae bacterium]